MITDWNPKQAGEAKSFSDESLYISYHLWKQHQSWFALRKANLMVNGEKKNCQIDGSMMGMVLFQILTSLNEKVTISSVLEQQYGNII